MAKRPPDSFRPRKSDGHQNVVKPALFGRKKERPKLPLESGIPSKAHPSRLWGDLKQKPTLSRYYLLPHGAAGSCRPPCGPDLAFSYRAKPYGSSPPDKVYYEMFTPIHEKEAIGETSVQCRAYGVKPCLVNAES